MILIFEVKATAFIHFKFKNIVFVNTTRIISIIVYLTKKCAQKFGPWTWYGIQKTFWSISHTSKQFNVMPRTIKNIHVHSYCFVIEKNLSPVYLKCRI